MKIVIFLSLTIACICGQGADLFLVAPNNLDTPEGNRANWPFTFEEFGINSRRYQQVYDASQFASIRPQGGYIKQLYFREGGPLGPGDTSEYLASVQINLGITLRAPDNL